jgi:hypothetical protein
MTQVPELTRAHGEHSQFVPGCGVCRFEFEARLAAQLANDPLWPRYRDVTLRCEAGDDATDETGFGDDYAGAWRELAEGGFTETYWHWHEASYHGGNNVYGTTQAFRVRHTFRDPHSGRWAWLTYIVERRR